MKAVAQATAFFMDTVTIDNIPVYNAVLADEECGMLRISLVDDPAVMSNFVAFGKDKKMMLYAVQNEEQRRVLGVVMRADFPIYRREPGMGEFYIIYRADSILEMAEKYLADGRCNIVNVMHKEDSDVEGVQMLQYFIKDGSKGISPEGFEEIADGSLFAEFHITNDDVWAKVKDGTYRGFSLEGIFALEAERDQEDVQSIVDSLDGKFSRLIKSLTNNKMSKVSKFLKALESALVSVACGTTTTDKGILAWDGDEDLKEGDDVFVEDAEGNRTPAEDGDYRTEDGKVITVVDGKVASITDAEAEVEGSRVATDKGELIWDGEEDLKEGDAVFTEDAEGNRVPAADGDYTIEDGKVIKVVDGKVSEIVDPSAEVATEMEEETPSEETLENDLEARVATLETLVKKMVEWMGITVLDENGNEVFSKTLKSQLDEIKASIQAPLAKSAHATFKASAEEVKTRDKGLNNLSRILGAK